MQKDALSLALSPNHGQALACALSTSDDTQMIGKPAIFSTLQADTTDEIKPDSETCDALGRATAYSIVARSSYVDILSASAKMTSGKPYVHVLSSAKQSLPDSHKIGPGQGHLVSPNPSVAWHASRTVTLPSAAAQHAESVARVSFTMPLPL